MGVPRAASSNLFNLIWRPTNGVHLHPHGHAPGEGNSHRPQRTRKRLILIASVLAATLTANSRPAFSSPVACGPLVAHDVSAELHRDSVARWFTTAAECFDAPSSTVAKAVANEPNRIYSARELTRRAQDTGPYHNFPESFNRPFSRAIDR
jgi:hypothetical protein